jgi:hypothetical protein
MIITCDTVVTWIARILFFALCIHGIACVCVCLFVCVSNRQRDINDLDAFWTGGVPENVL